MQISVGKSDGRRRFTLAHESAHLILDPIVKPPSFLEAPRIIQERQVSFVSRLFGDSVSRVDAWISRRGHEKACDILAAELLIPEVRVGQLVHEVQALSDLLECSQNHRVSLSFLVNRLNDYDAQLCFLRVQRTKDDDWLVVGGSGIPLSLQGRMACRWNVSPYRGNGEYISEAPMRLKVGGTLLEVSGQVRARNNYGVVLIQRGRLLAVLEGNESPVVGRRLMPDDPWRHVSSPRKSTAAV